MEKSYALYKKVMKKQPIEDYELVQMTALEIRETLYLLQNEINSVYNIVKSRHKIDI